jgi:hypothetical protein
MSDLDMVQGLLDLETVTKALGFPVNASSYASAVRALREARDAGSVCDAWNGIAGALGPQLVAAILSSDDWRAIARPTRPLDDYDSDDLSQAVWVGDKAQVVGRAQMDGDHLVAVRFVVESL